MVTFAAGIAMLIMVFFWARDTFSTIDSSFAQIRSAPAYVAPPPRGAAVGAANTAGAGAAKPSAAREAGGGTPSARPTGAAPSPGGAAQAQPGGPSTGIVAATLGLKLLGLLVLGLLAGMVAARGAHMVASALRPASVRD